MVVGWGGNHASLQAMLAAACLLAVGRKAGLLLCVAVASGAAAGAAWICCVMTVMAAWLGLLFKAVVPTGNPATPGRQAGRYSTYLRPGPLSFLLLTRQHLCSPGSCCAQRWVAMPGLHASERRPRLLYDTPYTIRMHMNRFLFCWASLFFSPSPTQLDSTPPHSCSLSLPFHLSVAHSKRHPIRPTHGLLAFLLLVLLRHTKP